jgi:tetratricopeptide (TPR) repeat protein
VRRAAGLLALLLGCAHSAPTETIRFEEPAVIAAGVDLPALRDEALQDQAAARWAESLEKLTRYLRYQDTAEAQIRAAVAEHHLGRIDAAAARLHALSQRPGLSALTRAEALLQEGVCRVELGDGARAEPLLRQAVDVFEQVGREERIDPGLPAEAEYWLGELRRSQFRAQALDPARMDERTLSNALESKAQLLLSAQEQYLRCIRRGDGDWATAAGFHIGEMYEELHDQLVSAPLPPGLREGQRALYHEQLRDRVRNLVQKAMRIYEETLAVAQRTGSRGEYVERTQAALSRMRRLLLGQN